MLPATGAAGQGAATEVEQILLHLDERGFVPYHPLVAERYGHKAAVLVGMALYWTRHSLRHHPRRGGWFHMSIQQWQDSIGLTRTEQSTVRETLLQSGVLEEMLLGRPAILNYRLNVKALAAALSLEHPPDRADPSWETVSGWFRGYQNYYKPLADIAGSIGAGLYLSLLLQRHRTGLLRRQLDNGCIAIGQDEISESLKLGTKVQRNARARLKRSGLIREAGVGGTLVRINLDAVLSCLRGQAIRPLKGLERPPTMSAADAPGPALLVKAVIPGGSAAGPSGAVNLTGLSTAFRQLSLHLTSTAATEAPAAASRPRDLLLSVLDESDFRRPVEIRQVNRRAIRDGNSKFDSGHAKLDKALLQDALPTFGGDSLPAKNAVSCKLEVAQTCKLEPVPVAETCKQELPFPATYIQPVFTRTTTTAGTADDAVVADGSSSDFGTSASKEEGVDVSALIFPKQLTEAQSRGVVQVLARVAAQDRQTLLDELEGRMGCTVPVKSPVGWLHGLVKQMARGPVVFAFAEQVAADRRERQEVLARVQRLAQQPATDPEGSPPVASSDVKQAHLARLAALRAEMRADKSAGRAK